MIYLLVLILLCLAVIAFLSCKEDLLSPFFIVCCSFLFSSSLAMLNLNRWNYDFHFETIIIILSGLICFGIGSFVSNYAFNNDIAIYYNLTDVTYKDIQIYRKILIIALVTLIMGVLAYLNYRVLYDSSIIYGNQNGFSGMVRTIRPLIEAKKFEFPRMFSYRLLVGSILGYLFLAIFLYKLLLKRLGFIDCFYLLPVIPYLALEVLTTGRAGFLKLAVFAIVFCGILYQKTHGYSSKTNCRIIIGAFIALALFLLLFFTAGTLTGKIIFGRSSLFAVLSHYTGANIPAFDVFLTQQIITDNNYIGETTLLGPWGNLRSMGFKLPPTSMFLKFVYFDGVSTNIYTSFRRYIQDYGFIGLWLITFLTGLIYTFFYNIIKYRSNSKFLLIIYSFVILPLFLYGHDELFLTTIMISRNLYFMIAIYLLCKIISFLKRGNI